MSLKTFLKLVLYILVVLNLFCAMLYARYGSQYYAVHQTVDGFVSELRLGDADRIKEYLYPDPAFVQQVLAVQKDNHEGFANITGTMEEHKWYPNYSWKPGVGESIGYDGMILLGAQTPVPIELNLVKVNGTWKIYHFSIH